MRHECDICGKVSSEPYEWLCVVATDTWYCRLCARAYNRGRSSVVVDQSQVVTIVSQGDSGEVALRIDLPAHVKAKNVTVHTTDTEYRLIGALRLQNVETKIANLQSANSILREKSAIAQQQVSSLQGDNKAGRSQVKALQEQVDELKAEDVMLRERLEQQREYALQRRVKLEAEVAALQEQVAAEQVYNKDILLQWRTMRDQWWSQGRGTAEKIAASDKRRDAIITENNALRKQVMALQEQVAKLVEQRDTERLQHHSLQDSARGELSRKIADFDTLAVDFNTQAKRLSRARKCITDLMRHIMPLGWTMTDGNGMSDALEFLEPTEQTEADGNGPQGDDAYADELCAMPEHLYRQMTQGRWDAATGQVHRSWDKATTPPTALTDPPVSYAELKLKFDRAMAELDAAVKKQNPLRDSHATMLASLTRVDDRNDALEKRNIEMHRYGGRTAGGAGRDRTA